MAAELSLNHNDLYKAMRTYIIDLFNLPGENVIRGHSNNAPLPVGDFVVMNIIHESDLSTTEHNYDIDAENAEVKSSIEAHMQIDFYGSDSARLSRTFCGLWRDYYACDRIDVFKPLFCTDPRHLPFTNEKSEYEERYTLTAVLNYIPVVTHDQDYVKKISITLNKI